MVAEFIIRADCPLTSAPTAIPVQRLSFFLKRDRASGHLPIQVFRENDANHSASGTSSH